MAKAMQLDLQGQQVIISQIAAPTPHYEYWLPDCCQNLVHLPFCQGDCSFTDANKEKLYTLGWCKVCPSPHDAHATIDNVQEITPSKEPVMLNALDEHPHMGSNVT